MQVNKIVFFYKRRLPPPNPSVTTQTDVYYNNGYYNNGYYNNDPYYNTSGPYYFSTTTTIINPINNDNLVPDTAAGGDRPTYQNAFYDKAYGLSNSSQFIIELLQDAEVDAQFSTVDNHEDVITYVAANAPEVAVIEALWLEPMRMRQIVEMFPQTRFYVRLHQHYPFLAAEPVAFQWLREYRNIYEEFGGSRFMIAANDEQVVVTLSDLLRTSVALLPNVYKSVAGNNHKYYNQTSTHLHIASYGSTRLLKNTLNSAVAAIEAANALGKYLYFHINGDDHDMIHNPIVRNLMYLFEDQPNHFLIVDRWSEYSEFIETMAQIHLNLQLSFTETFNLVSCDSIHAGIPVVTSDAINWLPSVLKVHDVQDVHLISSKIISVLSDYNLYQSAYAQQRDSLIQVVQSNANIWLDAMELPFNYNEIISRNPSNRRGTYVHYDRYPSPDWPIIR